MENRKIQDVFIIGSKGIPARYGGYETFVDNLTKGQSDKSIKYHVSCMANNNSRFSFNDADCFNVRVPNIGHAKAIVYDIKSINCCIKYISKNHIRKPIIYVLTCRIGPFFRKLVKKIHKLGGLVFLNPDGHEWMRSKWSKPVRLYWKKSEGTMVKNSDLIICDSKSIEKYISYSYKKYNRKTIYISYGSNISKSILKDNDSLFIDWLNKNKLTAHNYYLSVGRFVPENNFETMIEEFMASNTKKSFAIITTKNTGFFKKLINKLHFDRDPRIKFVGTVYNSELLKKIREQAFGYIHGHSVGGTNPSLLEALSSTKLNLLFDVEFNKEVAEDSALYWNCDKGNLSKLIHYSDLLDDDEINKYGDKAKSIIANNYSWSSIIHQYELIFKRTIN